MVLTLIDRPSRAGSNRQLSSMLKVVALLGFLGTSCGGAGDLPEGPVAIGGGSGPCEVGATRPCGLELGSDGTSITCARGSQFCQSGRWGACMPDAALGTTSVRVPPAADPQS